MQVELLVNGGYSGTGACVGKQFDAFHPNTLGAAGDVSEGYAISVAQLELAGFDNDGSVTDWLFFLPHEVRVIDG